MDLPEIKLEPLEVVEVIVEPTEETQTEDLTKDVQKENLTQDSTEIQTEERKITQQALASGGGQETSFKCDICGLLFPNLPDLENHLNIHNNDRVLFKCNTCGSEFAELSQIVGHQELHTNEIIQETTTTEIPEKGKDDEKTDQIEVKEKVLSDKQEPRRKRQGYQGIYERECNICGTLHRNYSDLRLHELTEHAEPVPDPFPIYINGRSNTTRYIGFVVKAYQCNDCDVLFPTLNDLENHRKVHKNCKVIFECTTCGGEFEGFKNLVDHEDFHRRADALTCDTCGKTFRKSSYLKAHLSKHHVVKKKKAMR